MSKSWEILRGDVRTVLKTLPSNYFDACLSDPPYGISFMGKRWDYSLPSVLVWSELLRVLKPGAHALLFGGTRTFHRLMCAAEDAGFLPRDCLMYLHGKGFPKSLDIAKQIDKGAGIWRGRGGKVKSANLAMGGANLERSLKGAAATDARRLWQGWGTALKPAYEPVLLVMKELEGTFESNVLKWGCGALAIDACRVGEEGRHNPSAKKSGMWSSFAGLKQNGRATISRWPANVMLDEEAAKLLDAQSGNRPGGRPVPAKTKSNPLGGPVFGKGLKRQPFAGHEDEGGASRFFYTVKVGHSEREAGCRELIPFVSHAEMSGREEGSPGERHARSGLGHGGVHNDHTTLKPIALTRWLATLLLPPPRTDGSPRRIVVPFAGAGSEMIGCLQAGWDVVIGIERDSHYIEIANARIKRGGVFSGLLDKKMREREREFKRTADSHATA